MRLFFLSICLLFAAQTLPATESPQSPRHPRLLATDDDFERIRASLSQPGPLNEAYELLLETGEREFEQPPLKRQLIGRRMLTVSRDALRRILNFSLLHHLDRDPRWAARAERELLALAAFSDWNPSHFLDTAEAATALAIGYDWLHDTLTPDSRRILREALVKHALRPGDDDKLWWRNRATPNNWLQVCEAGLALAALVVQEHEPELAARAITRARENVPAIFQTYEPSGAYVEGPIYWEYGTAYHVILIEALRTATGDDGGLAANAAFLQSAAVVNYLTAPSGDFFNFGDSVARRHFMPPMYWFARETVRPDLVADEHRSLRVARNSQISRAANAPLPNRFHALALLWMSPGPAAAASAPPASWKTDGPNPIAIFRQGEGRSALYAGIKGGRARISHGHMDIGSFILELGGVRWTTDLGMPSYHSLEREGVQLFGKDRWNVFVLGPHSHSIPLIDDALPDQQATAVLSGFSADEQSATVDLSPLYATQAKALHRHLRVESAE